MGGGRRRRFIPESAGMSLRGELREHDLCPAAAGEQVLTTETEPWRRAPELGDVLMVWPTKLGRGCCLNKNVAWKISVCPSSPAEECEFSEDGGGQRLWRLLEFAWVGWHPGPCPVGPSGVTWGWAWVTG